MPLFDYLCLDCGTLNEILVTGSAETPVCRSCNGVNLKKMLSAHASCSGTPKHALPGAGDTACCGSKPGAAGCAGPGSCCGKSGF
jgi:putative FmdB family regulatory protein